MKAIDRCSSVDELKAAQLSSTQTIGFLDFSFFFVRFALYKAIDYCALESMSH
jgi:hypothetical protein